MDLTTWKAELEARDHALQAEQSRLLALKDEMEPAIAARALRHLADEVELLERDWTAWLEEYRRGQE